MSVSPRGVTLIKCFEGCRLDAYRDGNGVLTIGWGHIDGVREGDRTTPEKADAMLEADLVPRVAGVDALVPDDCNQNQFDALVSFAFNEGLGALHRALSHGWENMADQFAKWRFVAGKESPGLIRRRAEERALFLEPI